MAAMNSGKALGSPAENHEPCANVATACGSINFGDIEVKEGLTVERGKDLAEILDTETNKCIVNPLSLPEGEPSENPGFSKKQALFTPALDSMYAIEDTPCLLCKQSFKDISEKSNMDEYLCHLIVEHKLVIADVKLIANLRKYVIYWKKRFAEKPLNEFCAIIKTNSSEKDIHPSEMYFLLCDVVAEDRILREELQLLRLKELIDIQSKERADNKFEKMCLFCTKFFIGNRNELFIHMNEDHNFNVGHPNNLVFVDEFLGQIELKLVNFECLYCDKIFKDRASLIEHMRKKSHRRLNPKNKSYDKYYMINYLELGKNWEVLQSEPDNLEQSNDWSGWEEEVRETAVCFFCSSQYELQDKCFEHMVTAHGFDYISIRKDMNLSFYQQIKMVNYIRRTVLQLKKNLEEKKDKGESSQSDIDMYAVASTISQCLSSSTKWNQPQYYFPTYENDTVLCRIEDKEGLFEPEDNLIFAEDGIDCKAIINGSILTDLVIRGYFD